MQDYQDSSTYANRDGTQPLGSLTQKHDANNSLDTQSSGHSETNQPQWSQEHQTVTNPHDETSRNYHPCCQHAIGSSQRRKCMDKLWKELEPQIKRFPFPGEFLHQKEDVLQQLALYFSRNLCPGPHLTARQPYNPDVAQLTTWLRTYWNYRIKDLYRDAAKEGANRKEQRDADGNHLDPEKFLPSRPSVPDVIQVIRQHIKDDDNDQLKRIHLPNRDDITAQSVLLTQVPPTVSFQDLAQELNVEYQRLYAWYRRYCKPVLLKLGEDYGHLDEGMD